MKAAALALGLAALWLLGRRYAGLSHDATVYYAQGLRRLEPAAFASDLFFAHGGQDAYTLFPLLYGPLIGLQGAGAALTMTVLGQAAFLAAATALAWRLVPAGLRWWSLALLAAVSGYYGGVGTFRIAEPFATARTLAEPLVLAGLAFALARRRWLAAAPLATALALHPLVAVPGIALVVIWHAISYPRLLKAVVWAGVLALAGVLAWPGAERFFDAPWREAVVERSPHLFPSLWHPADWARVLWGLCIAGLAAVLAGGAARRIVLIASGLSLASIAVSWIGVDLLDSARLAALQPWRMHWLQHLLAILLVPVVVAALWRNGNAGRLGAACIAASCCFGRAELAVSAALALAAVALFALERRHPGSIGERALRIGLLFVLCAASVGLLFEVQSRLPLAYGALQAPTWRDYVHAFGSAGGLLPAAALIWLIARSGPSAVALALCVAALACSALAWDARSAWSRFIESAQARDNPFDSVLPRGAQVLWWEKGSPAWTVLGTPSWISGDQGAGIVFQRATALEYAARKKPSAPLRSSLDNCAYADEAACRHDPALIQALCSVPRGPDFLVLNAPSTTALGMVAWRLPPDLGRGRDLLYLHPCRQK